MNPDIIRQALDLSQPQPPGAAMIERAATRYGYEIYDPGLAGVLPAAVAFREAVLAHQRPRRWLTLLGPSGCGKTHLLTRLYRDIVGRWAIPTGDGGTRMPQAAHIIPATDLQDWQAPRDYASYDLIYVEDIGAGSGTGGGAGAVLQGRIAELLQFRSGRWTMIDANLKVAEVAARLDGRIASRLRRDGSWLVQVPDTVPDYWWRDGA
jgi:DNA replication protein DnaC